MIARLRSHLLALVGERHPTWSPERLIAAEQYLARRFRSLGLDVMTHAVEAFGGSFHNVVATLPATAGSAQAAPLPPLILAAHYDTIPRSPGADDNASGLAVLLEVARTLRQDRLRRPIRFIAFCLEEEDLCGSLAYAARLRAAGEELLGAIVLECVGYASSEEGSQQAPPGLPIAVPTVGDFLAVVANQQSAEFLAALEGAIARQRTELKTVSLVVPGQGEQFPDTRRSDHAAFWAHGYPALMLTDTANFRNPHYHMPTDVIEVMDLGFMERVTLALIAGVRDLAGEGGTT